MFGLDQLCPAEVSLKSRQYGRCKYDKRRLSCFTDKTTGAASALFSSVEIAPRGQSRGIAPPEPSYVDLCYRLNEFCYKATLHFSPFLHLHPPS